MTLEQFKKSKITPKKRSKLHSFKSEIMELLVDYSLDSVTIFLKENGVKTSKQNLDYFLKRIQKQKPTPTAPALTPAAAGVRAGAEPTLPAVSDKKPATGISDDLKKIAVSYTEPAPQATLVGLTDEEIRKIRSEADVKLAKKEKLTDLELKAICYVFPKK